MGKISYKTTAILECGHLEIFFSLSIMHEGNLQMCSICKTRVPMALVEFDMVSIGKDF